MDNLSGESALDVNTAVEVFANMLEPVEAQVDTESLEDQAKKLEGEKEEVEEAEAEAEADESEAEAEEAQEEQKFTIKVDGKEIEVTLDELKNGYQRQADYTKKTMEVSEAKKAADTELRQATQERQEYANKLGYYAQSLQAALQEQSQTNWAELLESDPVEYLKQQRTFSERQSALQQAQYEQQQVFELQQQEQQASYTNYLNEQQQQLLAKLPAWKDSAKATAEKAEIKNFLLEQGFSDQDISQVADHRHVLLVRQAMNFAKLLKNAPDATKKVEKAPIKAERPGNSDANPLDGRNKAMQKLNRTGRVEDAAAVFASIL